MSRISKQEKEEAELTQEKVDILKRAYVERPVIGVVLDAFVSFQKRMEVPEEEEVKKKP